MSYCFKSLEALTLSGICDEERTSERNNNFGLEGIIMVIGAYSSYFENGEQRPREVM